jgi:cyanophycin synthetase
VAASYGTFVGNRCIERGNSASLKFQQNVLINPKVEAALFELTTTCSLGEGLGFDRCQVAVVTDVDPTEDLATWYFDDVDRLVQAKRVAVDVVLPEGFAVLNAADPLVASMAESSKGKVVYFATDAENPVLLHHRIEGGWAVFVEAGNVNLAEGQTVTPLVAIGELPWLNLEPTEPRIIAILAAIGAAWALGIPAAQIRTALHAYVPLAEKISQPEPLEVRTLKPLST